MVKNDEVEIEIRQHNGFTEWEKAKARGHTITQVYGRHQFLYKRLGLVMSLIEVQDLRGEFNWEICCLKGGLFEETERFKSKQNAENKIMKLLTPELQL